MTEAQERIYRYIVKYYKKHRVVPSARYLSGVFNMTQQGMSWHYNALIRKGKLKKVQKITVYELVDNQAVHLS